MRLRLALYAALGALVLGTVSDAKADTTPPYPFTFETVDSYETVGSGSLSTMVKISGILQGTTAPITTDFISFPPSSYQACDRMLAIVTNRPGRFYLTIARNSSYGAWCRLTRRP